MKNPTARKRNWSQLAFDYVFILDGGERLEVRSSVADAIRWEKNHGGKSFIEDTPSTSDLVWLGWAAAKRKQLTSDDFDLFASKIQDFAADAISWDEGDDAGLDPTQTAQSHDSSHD